MTDKMTDFKYNCSTYEYLLMESGLIPPPTDNPNYIVIKPNKDDKAIADGLIYQFINGGWISTGENERDGN